MNSPIDGQLNYVHLSVLMNNVAVNIVKFLWFVYGKLGLATSAKESHFPPPRKDIVEERISDLKDKTLEITQSEQQKEKRMKKSEESLCE